MTNRIQILFISAIMLLLVGCGKQQENIIKDENLTGTTEEILKQVYENASLSDEFRDSLQYYDEASITEDNIENLIGTKDITYSDGRYSIPMMSSVAYQCVLLRVPEDKINDTKVKLKENVNPRKWVCVEPESIQIVNNGDVILYVMADEETATALVESFKTIN